MKFNIQPLKEDDYDKVLVKWWKDWRWTPPVKDFLPDKGYMVYCNDIPVCAGYMYVTNSKVVLLEWIVSNFEIKNKETRKEALLMLIEFVTSVARGIEKKYVYSLLKSSSLIKIYEELGYIKGEVNGQEMIKIL